MNPLFKYAFIDENGEYYYVDSNGDVDTSVSIQYLEDDPKDWQNTQVSFTRDGDYHGMMRKSTTPLIFHSDPAKILRSIYYTNFANGYCKVEIYKQNRDFTTNNLNYALWYTCEVDFTQSTDGDMELPNGDVYFNVRLLELGLAAIIENHADDTYEIPVYSNWSGRIIDPDFKQIEIGDIRLNNNYEWVVPETKDPSTGTPIFRTDSSTVVDAIPFSLGNIFHIGDAGMQAYNLGAGQYVWSWDYPSDISFNIKFSFNYTNNSGSIPIQAELRRGLTDKNGVSHGETVIYIDPTPLAPGANRTIDVDLVDSISYIEDMRIYYIIRFTPVTINPTFRFTAQTYIKMEAEYSMPSSRCYGIPYKLLMQKMINKMAGNTNYNVVSNLLDDTFSDYFCRPGYCLVVPAASIRNIDDPKIKTTFTQLNADIRTMFMGGWGIEGNDLRIEKAPFFYNQGIDLLSISATSTVQKLISNDYIYNRIKIGFNDASVDEVNGLQEFCCEHEYNCGLSAPTIGAQELNLVSEYIHGIYSIENIRSYQFRKDNDSTPTDNETCVIEYNQIVGSVHYPAKTGFNGTDFTTGVKYPADIYNTGHSPKACLIRNLNYIKSYLKDGQIITFNTATKNALLEYGNTVDNIRIQENSDIEITTDGAMIPATTDLYPDIDRIFLPYIFQYKGEVPENLLALMETVDSGSFKKYGVVTIFDNGAELKMFVLDIGVNPASEDVYQIRGLCTPSVNLNNLIR